MLRLMGAQLAPLIATHWHETQPASGDLEIDWAAMYLAEAKGRIVTITARHFASDSMVVAYFLGLISTPLNQAGMQVLTELGFYVQPHHRLSQLGIRLLRYVEEVARILDCNRIEMYSLTMKDGRDAGPVYRRLGYQPAATQYLKDL
jgi:GNAT superfamily N-acetyltransferase